MKPDTIVVHHTASLRDSTTVVAVDRYHRDKDWDPGTGVAKAAKSSLGWYVQYHYFIEASGKVTKCAEENEIRWHAGPKANGHSIGVCLAGWFDDGHDDMPTEEQASALSTLLKNIRSRHNIPIESIVGHRFFMNKTCPGTHITDEWIRNLASTFDSSFGKKFAGELLLNVEDRGSLWYVTKDGKRAKIGRSPEEFSAFLKAVNEKKIPVIGIKNADIQRIQNV